MLPEREGDEPEVKVTRERVAASSVPVASDTYDRVKH